MICLCSDALLEATGETEDDSAPKSTSEKPPSTPEMDAHEAEELANSMMRNSPLPDPERSEEKLPEDDGSEKLPKEGGGEKLLEESPTGKLIVPFREEVPLLVWFHNPSFFSRFPKSRECCEKN